MHRKKITALAIAASAVAAGVLMACASGSRSLAALAEIPFISAWVLTYVWYKQDVAQRRLRTGTEFNGLVIWLSLLGLPIYLVRSRGPLRGIGASLVFYLAMVGWLLLAAGTLAAAMVIRGVLAS